MADHRVVCTREDGGVAVVIPSDECIDWLQNGYGLDCTFRGRDGLFKYLRGHFEWSWSEIVKAYATDAIPLEIAAQWEVHKMVSCAEWRKDDPKNREALAERWVSALCKGGLSYFEAIELIAKKDVPNFSCAPTIVENSEVPNDRWFRDAWRRSKNGGPIWIDIDKARAIHREHIAKAYIQKAESRPLWKRVTEVIDAPDWAAIKQKTESAKSIEQLRMVTW